jgi:hypothetical protein
MSIAKITKAYIRHYRDNDQVTAYVEWIDRRGKTGCTEGNYQRIGDKHWMLTSDHMDAAVAAV